MLKADPEFRKTMQSKITPVHNTELDDTGNNTQQFDNADNIEDVRASQAHSGSLSSQQVISLQRTFGNQATMNYLNRHRPQTGQAKVIQRALSFDASWAKGRFSFVTGYDPATAQAELTGPFDLLKTSIQDMRGILDKSPQLAGWNNDLVKLETFITNAEAQPITYNQRQTIKDQIANQAGDAATLKANIERDVARYKKAAEEKEKRIRDHEALMVKQQEEKRQKAEDIRLAAEADKIRLAQVEETRLEKQRLADEEVKRKAAEAEKLRVEQQQKLLAAKQLKDAQARLAEEARLKKEEAEKQEAARLLKEKTRKAFIALGEAAAALKATGKLAEARRILNDGQVPALLVGYNTAEANANAAYNVAKAAGTQSLETIELAKKAFEALEKKAGQVISTYMNDPAVKKARIKQAADWLCAERGKEQKILIADYRKAAEKFWLAESYGDKIKQKYQELYGSEQQRTHIATMKTPDQKILTKGAAVSAYISKLLAKGKISPNRVVSVYRTGSDPAPKYSIKVTLTGMTAHVLHAHMTGAHTVADGPDPVHIKKTTGGTTEIYGPSYRVRPTDFDAILPPVDQIKTARERSDLKDD
jgi:hypothetical protein